MSDQLDPLRRAIDAAKAIQADIDAMGMGKTAPEPLPEVPEALRYILWRYGQDHSGEDHQERVRVAMEWLGRIAKLPPPESA
jgi:hypothetical protein